MKKKIILSLAVIVCVVLVAVVVLLANLGGVIESTARNFLPKLTESEVQIDNVEVGLFSGTASVEGFVIGNPEGYKTESAIQFSEFSLKMDTASLKTDVIRITELIIKDPRITYEVGLGNSNVGTLIKNIEKNLAAVVKEKEETGEEAAGKKVVIDVVRIEGASVVLSAKLTQGIGAPIPLPVIEIKDLGKETEGIDAFKAFAVILKKLSTAVFAAVGDIGGAVVKGAADAAGAVVEGAAGAAGEVVGGAGKAAGEVVGGAGKVAGEVVGGAGKVAGDVVGGAGKAAEDVVGGAGKAVGGALKGLLGGKSSEEKEGDE